MQSHLLVAIHGIRTRRTSTSWPKHLAGWCAGVPSVQTEAIYYEAGPLPVWNNVFKNPRLARELVSRLETRRQYERGRKIHLIAHSNGGIIALSALRRLAALGIRVETLILTGAAVESDVKKSGLSQLIWDGHLGRAFAYSSPDDGVIRPALEWIPGFYGSLGSKGFQWDGSPTGLRVEGYQSLSERDDWSAARFRFVTRWFDGYGHGEYFDEANRPRTFETILEDCGVADDRV